MITYKIEMGESGNEFIPFAKRKTEYEVKIAEQFNRMAFSRNYQINEEVSIFVRAVKIAGNWTANLRVSGGSALEYFYSAFIESPCKCRDVYLVVSKFVLPTLGIGYVSGFGPASINWTYQGSDGVVYGGDSGSRVEDPLFPPGNMFGSVTNYLYAQHATTYTADYTSLRDIVQGLSTPEYLGAKYIGDTPAYQSAYAALRSAYASQQAAEARIRVIMSDGQELASIPNQNIPPVTFPLLAVAPDNPADSWSGNSYFQLVAILNSFDGFYLGQRLNFFVPEDACYPDSDFYAPTRLGTHLESLPNLVVTNKNGESDGVTNTVTFDLLLKGEEYAPGVIVGSGRVARKTFLDGTLIVTFINALFPYLQNSTTPNTDFLVTNGTITFKPDGTVNKSYSQVPFAPYVQAYNNWLQADPAYAQIKIEWVNHFFAGHAQATLRERARRIKCSKEFLLRLEKGAVPDELPLAMRRFRPASEGLRMQQPMIVETQTSTAIEGNVLTITKVVKLQYGVIVSLGANEAIPAPRNISVVVESITSNPDGSRLANLSFSQTITGTQKRTTITSTASSRPFVVQTLVIDYGSWLDIDSNGKTIFTAGEPAQGDFRFMLPVLPGQTVDRSFLCNIRNGQRVIGAANVKEANSAEYDPPYQVTSSNVSFSYPEIYVDYRARVKRENVPRDEAVFSFCDASFPDGELLDVYPLTVVHKQFGDLGIFAATKDRWDQTKVKLRCDARFTYKYNYVAGEWTLDSKAKFTNSPLMPYYDNAGNEQAAYFENFIFRSRKAFPDLVQEYKNQKKQIKELTPQTEPSHGRFQLYKKLGELK